MTLFLRDLAGDLLTQDNRITADPLFCVQEKRRVYGLIHEYTELFVWQWKEDPEYFWDTREEAMGNLLRGGNTADEFDDKLERVGYYEYYEFVTAHLTETAANRYVSENSHNLNHPRIFVTSQRRCHEFIKVVDYLKAQV